MSTSEKFYIERDKMRYSLMVFFDKSEHDVIK